MKWGTRILLSIAALVVLWVVVVFSIIGSFDTTPNFNFDFLSMQWLRAKSAASNQVGAMARGSGFADTFDLARDRRAREHCEGFTAEQRVRDSICLSLDCPGQSDEHYQAAAGRNVMISMTPCLVRAAWGEPDDIRSITKAGDMSERWMYGDDDVLFKNGEVSILEDRP